VAQPLRLRRIAASRNEWWRFSAVVGGASKGGRRIDNPPQVTNLPHNSSRHAKKLVVHSAPGIRRGAGRKRRIVVHGAMLNSKL